MSVKLVVGLGNPGMHYANTRHNIGFRCLNHFAKTRGISVDRQQCRAKVGYGKVGGNQIVLAKPRTFMNSSGEAVHLLVKRFNITLHDILVIHDDLDLPLGGIRLRGGGGSGGHKGVASIIECLGSPEFPRIRVGVGRPQVNDEDVIAYVLGAFSPTDSDIADHTIIRVTEAVNCFLTEGIVQAMNKYN